MNENGLKERKQRAMELVLEDEVFIGRVNKLSPIPTELLKKIEEMVENAVEKLKDIEDDDEAYIKAANEVRRIKNQMLNELKRQKFNN